MALDGVSPILCDYKRPDLMYIVHMLTRFNSKQTTRNAATLTRALHYAYKIRKLRMALDGIHGTLTETLMLILQPVSFQEYHFAHLLYSSALIQSSGNQTTGSTSCRQ